MDGTCELLGASLARCTKLYNQGQVSSPTRSSDHPTSQIFMIPSYANTSFNVIVKVGGLTVTPGSDTWTINSSKQVIFSPSYQIFNNQSIAITYFVSSNVDSLFASRQLAQDKVDSYCACGEGIKCNLEPVNSEVNGEQTITSYQCLYSAPPSNAPLQETIFMSARTVAHRFYDANGVNYKYNELNGNLAQECAQSSGDESNCTRFQNINDDASRPNNDSYIGFNEILGTFNLSERSPIPAVQVDVKRSTAYDIFVDQGVFSSCIDCGRDYYSNLQKVFPDNFDTKGGGYRPDFVESRRQLNQGSYNADDMKFGRACFVPPTMIPWTHKENDDIPTQRRNRLRAQHFMFANGYNKDWYGFDYGSLIGSFDGVTWFSVGNQRRIQSTSTKLFLAINAYFGDVTTNNTFRIVINETASVINSGSTITHNTDSDGAECQQAHFCSTDNDCITNLGYDYTCQNVGSLNSPWPIHDASGNEISGSSTRNLLSLVGGSNQQPRRCVYRGRGASCKEDLTNLNTNNSFSLNDKVGLNGCSQNTYCANLSSSRFNDKIARFGISPTVQNNKPYITTDTDTVGLGARILGRPFDFYGLKTAPTGVANQLSSLNVDGLCVPGKDPESAVTTLSLNNVSSLEADKILGIGRTFSSSVQNENYYSACPATDEDGNFTHFLQGAINNSNHAPFAVAQNMSTNSLSLSVFNSLELFNDQDNLVTKIGYHKNTCLRAPGASCFTDLDCSPNEFISNKIKTITNFLGQISEAEQNFWKEELVCGNGQPRFQPNSIIPNPSYDTSQNRCCREVGKEFTYYSMKHEGSEFTSANGLNSVVPGVNIDIDDPQRYSRTHTTYDKQLESPLDYPPLTRAAESPTLKKIYSSLKEVSQYNTLHLNNSRMCCTGAWVREFAEGSSGNNGGHKFSGTSGQNYDFRDFKKLNWFADIGTSSSIGISTAFICPPEDIGTAFCEVRNISEGSNYETTRLEWLSKFELLGIPQVLIETNRSSTTNQTEDIFTDLDDSQQASATRDPIPGTIKRNDGGIVRADSLSNNIDYYSAGNVENFEIDSNNLKRVFSENKFNCCLPAGPVPTGTSNEQCCTGQFTQTGDRGARCCLPGNTDVTTYTNRYVSSEGATLNGMPIPDSDIDALTGNLKKETVLRLAQTICCSGQAEFGHAISILPIAVNGNQVTNPLQTTRRFIENEATDQGPISLFEAGRKWNNHVYCVDSETSTTPTTGSVGN